MRSRERSDRGGVNTEIANVNDEAFARRPDVAVRHAGRRGKVALNKPGAA